MDRQPFDQFCLDLTPTILLICFSSLFQFIESKFLSFGVYLIRHLLFEQYLSPGLSRRMEVNQTVPIARQETSLNFLRQVSQP